MVQKLVKLDRVMVRVAARYLEILGNRLKEVVQIGALPHIHPITGFIEDYIKYVVGVGHRVHCAVHERLVQVQSQRELVGLLGRQADLSLDAHRGVHGQRVYEQEGVELLLLLGQVLDVVGGVRPVILHVQLVRVRVVVRVVAVLLRVGPIQVQGGGEYRELHVIVVQSA